MRLSAIFILLALLVHSPARADRAFRPAKESNPDSACCVSWEAIYDARANLRKNSPYFPWNDPADSSHLSDRAVFMLHAESGPAELFFKAATGLRHTRHDRYESSPVLRQGHVSVKLQDGLKGRFFIRERVFRASSRLSIPLSEDSPFLSKSTEGAFISLRRGGVTLSYTGAAVRDMDGRLEVGGFPSLSGPSSSINLFSISGKKGGVLWGDLSALDMRAEDEGDASMIMLGSGVRIGAASCGLEYFLSSERGWKYLGGAPCSEDDGGASSLLPANSFLAAEIWGLEINAGSAGAFGLAPGYRFAGRDFAAGPGEIEPGSVTSFADLWWRHPELSVILDVDLAESWRRGMSRSARSALLSIWTRFEGGFECRETAVFRRGERPALAFSLTDDNGLSRVSAAARLDDAGLGNEFSFLADAGINLGERWTLGGTVYLERSERGFYSADLEMRSGRRFMFILSAGSYSPIAERIDLEGPLPPDAVTRERSISLRARFSLGGLG